jgi:hypothetical protein
MIAVIVMAALGISAAVYLAGLPRPGTALLHPTEFQRATDMGAVAVCAVCGAAPLTMLSVAYTGHARLPLLLAVVVVPAYFVVACLGTLLPETGRRAWTGFLSGVVAVLAYDMIRLALSYSQGAGDPIPHIGVMLMGRDDVPWWVGYVWRTFGNGAGLGITYVMICPRGWWGPRTGLVYGTVVCAGMVGFLAVFPQAQDVLFPLTWATVVNGTLGHWVYGLVLGSMARSARRRQNSPDRLRAELRARWGDADRPTTGGRHAKRSRWSNRNRSEPVRTRPRTDEVETTAEMWPVQDTPPRGVPRHPERW